MDEPAAISRRLKLVASNARTIEFQVFESKIADYVAGDLSPEDQASFEEALLANPDWASWVEAEEALRAGIRSLAAVEPQLFAPTPEVRPAGVNAVGERRVQRVHRWVSGLALAATATFAALFVNTRQQLDELELALLDAQAPKSSVEFIRLDEMRGVTAAGVRALPSPHATVVLEIPAGPSPLESYRVRIVRDDEIVWDLSPARADADGLLLISVPGSRLQPGNYRAVLSSTAELAIPVGSYEFVLR